MKTSRKNSICKMISSNNQTVFITFATLPTTANNKKLFDKKKVTTHKKDTT